MRMQRIRRNAFIACGMDGFRLLEFVLVWAEFGRIIWYYKSRHACAIFEFRVLS